MHIQMRITLSVTITAVVGSDEEELADSAILLVGHPKGFCVNES